MANPMKKKKKKHGFTNLKKNYMEHKMEMYKNKKMIQNKHKMRWKWGTVEKAMQKQEPVDPPHLGCAGGCQVYWNRAALTGHGSVGRSSSWWRPRPPAPVAETGHDLSGALWDDELLSQLQVGPAFSWEIQVQMSCDGQTSLVITFTGVEEDDGDDHDNDADDDIFIFL